MGHSALSARGKLGATARRFPNDPDRLAEARRDLAAAKLQDYIERTLADAPPLSDAQRERLALLLHRPAVSQQEGDGLTPGRPPRTDPAQSRLAQQTLEGQR
jgi:hypothetical protein